MVIQVQLFPKVERQLAALKKQGKTRSIAADRARRIINALIRGMSPTSSGLLKRKTDKRMKNCLKFDLGSGFRLICINEGKNILIITDLGVKFFFGFFLENSIKIFIIMG